MSCIAADASAAKDQLTINSQPSGAFVEIDGVAVGRTPYSIEVPGGYLRDTKSPFAKRLHHQMHLKLSLNGFFSREADLAIGPMPWIGLIGTYRGEYWLLKSDTFNFGLEAVAPAFTGMIQATLSNPSPTAAEATLSTEEIVKRASPAVLYLSGAGETGSGFLITETGIAVTNAHVSEGKDTLTAMAVDGKMFQCKVVYVDPSLDIALLKLDGSGFPKLRLAATQTIQPGSTVVAIGTPSNGFQNSVSRGVVSGIGVMKDVSGLWIQTDAAMNPGNSGGPLLNVVGEVVGITTKKEFVSDDGRTLQGIGFALSSSDLLTVVQKFFPDVEQQYTSHESTIGKARVSIASDFEGADIYIDDRFVGEMPARLSLPSGKHKIEVKDEDGRVWSRSLDLLEDSDVNLRPQLRSTK